MSRTSERPRVWTVGHSTRSFEELMAILGSTDRGPVEVLADIRTVPRSRRHPQFNLETLAEELPRRGIRYVHLPRLGGFRRPRADSPNGAWRNESFRGYADYMQTPAFDEAIEELMAMAAERRTAVMCSEAVPWRCHRSLVADALMARGGEVTHLMSATKAQAHTLTSFACVEGERVTYPAAEGRATVAGKEA